MGHSRVTLSLRLSRLRAACSPQQEGRALKSAPRNDARSQAMHAQRQLQEELQRTRERSDMNAAKAREAEEQRAEQQRNSEVEHHAMQGLEARHF